MSTNRKTIKIVNRRNNIRLQHIGKTGPQGASVSSRWGTIVGSINDQDDLFAYLASKADTSDLGSAAFKDSSFFANALGSDENYVTDAEKEKLFNLSGINTGDQDLSDLVTKNSIIFNIIDYGAVPDGDIGAGTGTNNTASIQAAIDAAGENGGTVYIPSGTFRLNSPVTPKSNVTIKGNGSSSVLFCPTPNTTTIILHAKFASSGIELTDFSVDNVTFVGGVTSTTSVPARSRTRKDYATTAIWLTGSLDQSNAPSKGTFNETLVSPPDLTTPSNPAGLVKNISITNCIFRNFGWLPTRLFGVSGKVLWTHNEAYNCMDIGFGFNEEVIFSNNDVRMSSDNGVSISRGNNKVVVSDNAIENCAYSGIYISGYNGYAGPTDFTCVGNTIKTIGNSGILMQDQVTNGVISANVINRGPYRMGSDTYVSGIQINGNAGDFAGGIDTNLIIAGNLIKNGMQAGVLIDNAKNIKVSNNIIVDTGSQYKSNGTTAILSSDTTQNIGVYFPNPLQVSSIVVSDNMINDTRTPIYTNYAIYPQTSTDNISLSRNSISNVNNDVNKIVYGDNAIVGNYPTESIAGPDANVGKVLVLKGNARSIIQTTNEGSVTSILHLKNTGATSGSGVGLIASSGTDLNSGFIGGALWSRTDATSNSDLYFRVLSNGSLTPSNTSAPFYLSGSATGVIPIFNVKPRINSGATTGYVWTATNSNGDGAWQLPSIGPQITGPLYIGTWGGTTTNVNFQSTYDGVNTARFINIGAQSTSGGAGVVSIADPGAAIISGNRLGFFLSGGASDSNHTLIASGGMNVYATETWGTGKGTKLVFQVTKNTESGRTTALTLDQDLSATFAGQVNIPTLKLGSSSVSGQVWSASDTIGNGSWSTLTKSSVGLSNVDNTSDANKPISTATQTALNAKLAANTPIVGATKTKITYDANGLVTTGADATTADIADSANKRYVTDAQQTVLSNTSGTNTGDETTSTIKTKLGITTLSGSNTGDQDLSVLQPKDATLTSLAAYNTNGLLTQTSADTFTGRTITGTTNQVTVTNGDGVSGNPTLSLPQNIHTGATPTFAGVNFGAGALESTRVWINNDTPITFGGGTGNSSSFKAGSDGTFLFDVGGGVNIALKGGDASGNSYMRYTDSSWNMAWQVDTLGRMTVRSGGSIGTSSSYIPNTYTSRLYLNSTAYIDGATAGVIGMSATAASATAYQFSGVTSGTILEVLNSTNDSKFAIRTTGTGKGAYNYLQGTTNYISTVGEVSGKLWWRVGSFGGNNFTIRTNNDGFSGYSDAIALVADGSQQVSLPATSSISAGTFTGLKVSPTLTQSGTANYTALLINPTETSTGSGTKLLIDAQVGGTSKFKVDNAGNTTLVDAANIAVGTTTGTKLGTATSQKLSFWNATPIVQPTTSVGASTFTANSGTAVNDASTFDGYTIKQVVKALRNIGLLA